MEEEKCKQLGVGNTLLEVHQEKKDFNKLSKRQSKPLTLQTICKKTQDKQSL